MKTPEAITLELWLGTQGAGLGLDADAQSAFCEALNARAGRAESQIAAVEILAILRSDVDTRLATLLWPAFEESLSLSAELVPFANASVLELLHGHAEARRVWPVYQKLNPNSDAESIRRLLLVLIKDVRVVLILLAEQLVLLKNLARGDDDSKRAAAQVTRDIHAPLANRLGIWQIKWELEDLAFRYLQPDVYKRIAGLLDERRGTRESYIDEFIGELKSTLAAAGIESEVVGRPKHIFSIYKKMQKKGLEFSELYDVRAVRVIVKDLVSCYAALGAVHSRFQPIPKEFDDYIANPKGNNYRSLHTAVIGPEEKSVEIQIRTQAMHDHAEHGVAAHWAYKEAGTKGYAGVSASSEYDAKIAVLRQLLAWERELSGPVAAKAREGNAGLFEDRIYVLTPDAAVVELPQGATALDFAYSVHTSLGHRCRGARIDGAMVPLNTPLVALKAMLDGVATAVSAAWRACPDAKPSSAKVWCRHLNMQPHWTAPAFM